MPGKRQQQRDLLAGVDEHEPAEGREGGATVARATANCPGRPNRRIITAHTATIKDRVDRRRPELQFRPPGGQCV